MKLENVPYLYTDVKYLYKQTVFEFLLANQLSSM